MVVDVYFDGCCIPNPGEMSYGFFVIDNSEIKYEEGRKIGYGTNNVAEYTGALAALQYCTTNNIPEANIIGDSLLVVNQLNNKWKVKNEKLKIIHSVIKELMKNGNYTFKHVYRNFNERADILARNALSEGTSPQPSLPKESESSSSNKRGICGVSNRGMARRFR